MHNADSKSWCPWAFKLRVERYPDSLSNTAGDAMTLYTSSSRMSMRQRTEFRYRVGDCA